MTEIASQSLDGVAETLLVTLYIRALETQRPDALLNDQKALDLVRRMESAFDRIKGIRMDEEDRVGVILRNREIDNLTRDFLSRPAEAAVVHIGCGLDSRFERVDNGRVEWYDLDLPEVIELRRKLFGSPGPRSHLLAGSAFDVSWFAALTQHRGRPLLLIAEGVFQYFAEAQVKSLVVALREHFPGAELIFDAFSPFIVRANNLRMALSKMSARYHWGLSRGRDVEGWTPGVRLLSEWFPLSLPEPRLAKFQWARNIPLIAKAMGVYHYRLGDAVS
jgi:O-methyltransferase involved in polyketide biosynthesis